MIKKITLFTLLALSWGVQAKENQDIYLIDTENQCLLTPPGKNYKNYGKNIESLDFFLAKNGKILNKIKLNKTESNQEPCLDTIYINEKDKEKVRGGAFATNQTKELFPKKIIENKAIAQEMSLKIHDFLNKKYKLSVPRATRTQVLDGFTFDGKEYVIVESSNFNEENAYAIDQPIFKGMYSGIYLIPKFLNEVITILEDVKTNPKDLMNTPPILNNLRGYLDIDDDGEYELLISSKYYEGETSLLFKIVNGKPIEKRNCSCGL